MEFAGGVEHRAKELDLSRRVGHDNARRDRVKSFAGSALHPGARSRGLARERSSLAAHARIMPTGNVPSTINVRAANERSRTATYSAGGLRFSSRSAMRWKTVAKFPKVRRSCTSPNRSELLSSSAARLRYRSARSL